MKERPILFSAPMIRAIIEGRKTQTRRIVKPQPAWETGGSICFDGEFWRILLDGEKYKGWTKTPYWKCPYGIIGDRLWVRETWREGESHTWSGCNNPDSVHYRADADEPDAKGCWKPSIFMPRWASRITLEVTDVRVERLQKIIGAWHNCREDVAWEGLPSSRIYSDAEKIDWFSNLWRSINGPDSWDENPLVWVISFKRIGG